MAKTNYKEVLECIGPNRNIVLELKDISSPLKAVKNSYNIGAEILKIKKSGWYEREFSYNALDGSFRYIVEYTQRADELDQYAQRKFTVEMTGKQPLNKNETGWIKIVINAKLELNFSFSGLSASPFFQSMFKVWKKLFYDKKVRERYLKECYFLAMQLREKFAEILR
ncbi:MAG: hypothetical protein J7K83_03825 [Candidatus Aenigmarchaeota archaeon]|nr:hypothetical protein [Candidatus Aenigmarchaeota archaeon]